MLTLKGTNSLGSFSKSANNNISKNGKSGKSSKKEYNKDDYDFAVIVTNKGGSLVGLYNGDPEKSFIDTYDSATEGCLTILSNLLDTIPTISEGLTEKQAVIYIPDCLRNVDNRELSSCIKDNEKLKALAVDTAKKIGERLLNIKLILISSSSAKIVIEACKWLKEVNKNIVKSAINGGGAKETPKEEKPLLIGGMFTVEQLMKMRETMDTDQAKAFVDSIASTVTAEQLIMVAAMFNVPAPKAKKASSKKASSKKAETPKTEEKPATPPVDDDDEESIAF